MEEFHKYCLECNLEKAKEIYNLGGIDTQTKNKAFLNSCYNDHLFVAQWLYSLGDIDIHIHIKTIKILNCNPKIQNWIQSFNEFPIWLYNIENPMAYIIANN